VAILGRSGTLLLLAGVQLAALVATFPGLVAGMGGLGTAWWHHIASLGVVLAAILALRRPMQSRRFLAIGVLAFTILATVSGFYLLYWKEGIRADGYQDWGVFWHVAWSWAAALFFWQHTWVNRIAFAHFFRRTFAALRPAAVHLSLYAVGVTALVVTWGPAKSWFTNENYIPLSFAFWLVATLAAYVSWWLLRRRDGATQKRIRGGVDLGLVPLAALAVITGIPLLFLDPQLDVLGLKYASKVWHVWPSVVFAVLVFVHGAQTWSTVRAHWRKLGQERKGVASTASKETA
jgi:hypothetical protein